MERTELNRSIEIQEKIREIVNLDGFIERQNDIDIMMQTCKYRRNNHIKLLGKVLKLKKILENFYGVKNIDPIKYIRGLYTKDFLSIDDIAKKLMQIYISIGEKEYFYTSGNSLQKFLAGALNWKLRDKKDSKKTNTYKSREKPEKLVLDTIKQKEERKALFLSWFIKNSKPDFTNFDIIIFNSYKYKYEKLIYILKNCLYINSESYHKLKELKLGNQSFADRFNEIFKENNIDFSISHKDIARIFEKY